jgi:hypothetical protein
MITTLLLFIFSLVRASQVENKRISEGRVDKKPPPPPKWESFQFLTRYYGGIRTLVPFTENSPQYPKMEDEQPYNSSQGGKRSFPSSKVFADYTGSVFAQTNNDDMHECFLDTENQVKVPLIRYYDGRPSGFPNNVLGSYDQLSLPEDVCFERYGRYGPYGFGYSITEGGLGVGESGEREGSDAVWQTVAKVNWRNLDWADVQRRCFNANSERFKALEPARAPPHGFFIGDKTKSKKKGKTSPKKADDVDAMTKRSRTKSSAASEEDLSTSLPRTAFVVRCWDEFEWNQEARMNLRALISEISLASGGQYDVHLLVEVKNDGRYPIWADDEAYQQRIKDSVPEEFQGLVTLWSQTQMLAVYQGMYDLFTTGPDRPLHGAYRGLQMAMQYFAYNHAEYDYFWQWEMDIRYTGHYYDLLSKLENWAKKQPRKGLWERNGRFYVPEIHGSWEDFKQMVRVQSETGTLAADNIWDNVPGAAKDKDAKLQKAEHIVWGAMRPKDEEDWFETETDPVPPTSYERDKYSWGVGEEADLIAFNPLFDPEGTTWGLAEDITGYNEGDGNGKPPRRAQIITASRMSRQLLLTMHRETAFKKHHAFPEMWPATVSLHHGYKAVSVPHPIYVDREWPVDYMARVLNGGKNGASGGSRNAVFGTREHNMRGLSWFYNSGFGGNLYRRWLGLRVNNDGGEEFETTEDPNQDESTVGQMRGGEGRMCLPPMLLHPVKSVELPVDLPDMDDLPTDRRPKADGGRPTDDELPDLVESDPAA